ncbi:MAG: type II secretion system protein [Actinomycetota bacterium]
MFKAIHDRLNRDEEGFTLIELMVVVLIIAILIAIAIPTFLGARQRAQDKQAQSNIRNALTTEKTYYVDNQAYTATSADLTAIEASLDFTKTDASVRGVLPTLVTVGSDTAGGVCLESDSKSGSKFFLVDVTSGTKAGTWYGINNGTKTASCPADDTALPGQFSQDATTGWK